MSFVPKLPVAASLSADAISVASMSKSYGIPGIRVGWLITRDEKLFERFLAAKEQIGICGSIIDEHIAEAALTQSAAWLATVDTRTERRRSRPSNTGSRARQRMEWVKPEGGCVCFPRIKADAGIDVEKFYRALAADHATAVGPGHWFEQDKRFMRIGFGWPLPNGTRRRPRRHHRQPRRGAELTQPLREIPVYRPGSDKFQPEYRRASPCRICGLEQHLTPVPPIAG